MRTTTIALSLLTLTAVTLDARITATQHDSVAGTWIMALTGDHVVSVALVLEQTGTTVTGSVTLHDNDIPVTGEYHERTLTLATPDDPGSVPHGFGPLKITATMQDDGTIAGDVDSTRGRMAMTAARLKKRG